MMNKRMVSAVTAPLTPSAIALIANAGRLEHGALRVLRPAAQPAPDRDDDAGEPGGAAEDAIEQANSGVRRRAAGADRLHRRPRQPVDAVQDRQPADARPDIMRIGEAAASRAA